MNNKAHAFCIIAALWIFVSPVHGTEQGIRVSIQDSIAADFEAPGLISGAFLVSNLDTVACEVFEELLLPDDWTLVTGDLPFELEPGGRDVRIVGISVPANTPPGEYTITYRARDLNRPEESGQASLHVEVKSTAAIELSVKNAPPRVEAGSDYTVEYGITHRGNSAAQVDLTAQSSTGFKVKLDSSRVNLQPGESRRIQVVVSTPRRLEHAVKDRLFLQAKIAQDTLITGWKAASTVDVILKTTTISQRYRQLPSRFTARYVGGDDIDGMQFEYSGAGFVDEKNRYHLDYRYSGPRNFERSVYGVRDEYYLKLRSKEFEVRAGDQAFTLSNLLERSQLGRGLSGKYEARGVEAGVMGFGSRPQYQDLEAYGAYVGKRIDRRLAVRGSILDKRSEDLHNQIFSIASTVTPYAAWKADLEYAASIKDSSNSKTPQAFWGRLDGNYRGITLSMQKHYADGGFAGYIQDEDQNLFDVYAPLPRNFGWMFSFRTLAQNLDEIETKPSAARERHIRTGIRYRNPLLLSGSLDIENHERVDQLSAPDYDNRATFVAARLQKSYRSFNLSGAIIQGYRQDYLAHSKRDHESYRVGADWRPDSDQNYGVWFQSGHSGYSVDARRSRIFGILLGYRVIPKLCITANLQARDRDTHGNFESTQYDFCLQYEPFRNHIFVFKIRHLDYDELQIERDDSYLLSYEIPFGLPIGRKQTTGDVKGRVYETESSRRAGVSGVAMRLGNQTALTNEQGNFAFRSVKPGTQYLQIENAGIGLDRLTKQVMPIEVQVRGGETETINLEITGSGSVSGDLAVYGFIDLSTKRGLLLEQTVDSSEHRDQHEMVRLDALAGAFLTLRSGKEVIQAVTDADGKFTVTKLRPGRWTIEISEYGLPRYHEPEKRIHEIELRPNQSELIDLRVIPSIRKLVITDSGTLRLSESETTPVPPTPMKESIPAASEPSVPVKDVKQIRGDKQVAISAVADSSGDWFVQAGGFRNRQDAEQRSELLRNAGYKAILVPLESAKGTTHQVRVGGFATKQIADSVSTVLNRTFDFPTQVITSPRPQNSWTEPEHHRHTPPAVENRGSPLLMDIQTTGDGHWFVQVGAFRNPKNAERMTERLRQANLQYKLVPSIADSTLMQVRVGGFEAISDSRSAAERLDSWLEMQTLVIRDRYKE